jgi:tetratricopeptide (TPR) repeat protein
VTLQPWHRIISIFATVVLGFVWLGWKCVRDPTINFLPRDSRAEWILFPTPLDARSHRVATIDALFRRAFSLESQPKTARVEVRSAKRLELKINGEQVQISAAPNWKAISTADVSNFLRSGENTIEARVFDDDAPPAFWLRLTADRLELRSDGSWDSSLAGSSWRKCALVTVPRMPGLGNPLGGGERIFDTLSKIWPAWILFGVLAIMLTTGIARYLKKEEDVGLSRGEVVGLVGTCVLAWVFLFWNNAKMLPFHCGYDSNDHLAYIKYIQDRGALPLPNEGYEMFQPPLFYALSAGVLSIFRLSVNDDAAVLILRALTTFFGIANFILVFLSMRLVFPRQPIVQAIGLLTAAFLPMQLYLSHYITNETLAGTLVSAAVYFGLRELTIERAPLWLLLVLGCCTGTAMLAKATSLLLVPPLYGALLIKLARERASLAQWLRVFGVTTFVILLTCGWHYFRIWRHFGTPIVGNWERVLGFPWWQDPGFRTASDYFRFGRALIAPLFSGFNGFEDGIYSTLWGDSLCGGLSGLLSRTPWNYPLMIGGYWVALIPSTLVLVGSAVAIYRFTKKISPEWFLLIGFSAAMAMALIFMTLRVASYAQVKAFYGLSAVIPFCCFAALAWRVVTARLRAAQFLIGSALIFFSINSFASVWIRPSTEQRIYSALRLITASQPTRALAEATAAVESDPSSGNASYVLAAVLDESGQPSKAVAECERCLEINRSNGDCLLELAVSAAKGGDAIRAINSAFTARDRIDENARVHDVLFALARELHYGPDALVIGREALVVSPFDSDLHYRVGLAAGELGDFKTAAQQFGYASLLAPNRSGITDKLHLVIRFATQALDASAQLNAIASAAPDSPALLNELGWIFSTHPDAALRNGPRAIRLSQRACDLTELKEPRFLATLAAAYAETGKFSEAVSTARDAASLARANGDAETAAFAEKLLMIFQSHQPYREEPR